MQTVMLLAAVVGGAVTSTEVGSPPSWLGDYYRLQLMKDDGQTAWTIHGLWPNWSETGYCRQVTFNESKIVDLLPEMRKVWPSDEEKDEKFWTHEWEKHGSCADGMDEHAYFSLTLRLYEQVSPKCPHAGDEHDCNFCWFRNLTAMCDCTADGPGSCPHS